MAGNPFTDPNWAPDLANTVERVVSTVREQVTDKVVLVVRGIVFGVVIAFTALAALVLGTILSVRFLQVVLSRIVRTDHDSTVWVSYLTMSALLFLLGFIAMRMRVSKDEAR
jgi:H+/Cl- antiporter ClcA